LNAIKISLGMIVRNVEKTISPCLASVVPFVDEIVIVDTGSTDSTKTQISKAAPIAKVLDFHSDAHPQAFTLDAARSWKDMPGPFTGQMMLSDFSAARKHGWDACAGDYIMWIDADDVLEGGANLRQLVEKMKSDGVDTAILDYDYAHDENGRTSLRLKRERIVRRMFGASWSQPIHELLGPPGHAKFFSDVKVIHKRSEYKLEADFAHRNLKVLMKWAEGEDLRSCDPRLLFYLGMEERLLWPEKAREHFQLYCKRSGWDEERSVAHMFVGSMHEQSGSLEMAFVEYSQAAIEAGFRPEPYFGLARIAYTKKQWDKCIEWTERGIQIASDTKGRESILMYNPADRTWRPYLFYTVALVEMSRFQEAADACEKGLTFHPTQEDLLKTREAVRDLLREKACRETANGLSISFKRNEPLDTPALCLPQEVLTTFSLQLWKHHMDAGRHDRAIMLLQALPEDVLYADKLRDAMTHTMKKKLSKS
jgi:glycosyltransferase involved in cell wall biosynthesis